MHKSASVVILLGGLVSLALCISWRYSPSPPLSVTASASVFSADRAFLVLLALLREAEPHPVGSAQNTRVRRRIIGHLLKLGYKPSVQRARACGRNYRCADIHNIVTVIEGSAHLERAIMMSAHYDSTPHGPGAGDNGAGVAALLEIARVLKDNPPRHDVILLMDDGEEAGLLGAEAFVDAHPLTQRIGVVINLEARGSSGPSLMFETSEGDAWLVDRFATWRGRPTGNSLTATVYDSMPNLTSLTVFKEAGLQGINFGFIGTPEHYHTPQDTLENLSTASLQHQGAQALRTLRDLDAESLEPSSTHKAIFFDILTLGVIWWPLWFGWILALMTTVGLACSIRYLCKSGLIGLSSYLWGLSLPVMVVGITITSGLTMIAFLRLTGVMKGMWPEMPRLQVTLFGGVSLTSLGAVSALVGQRAGVWGSWLGLWTWTLLMVIFTTTSLPGASYLFVAPMLFGLIGTMIGVCARGRGEVSSHWITIPPWLTAGVLIYPIALLLSDAMGNTMVWASGVMISLGTLPMMPALNVQEGRWRWATMSSGLVVSLVALLMMKI